MTSAAIDGARSGEPAPRDLRRATAAERDAVLRELWTTLGPRVQALGWRYFGGRGDLARELVSETFARAIASIHRFEGRSSYGTWIWRIAMNVAAHWARAASCHPEAELAATRADERSASSELPPEAALGDEERRRLVDEALRALSPEHRMVLALVVVDGLPQAEAAALLGVPVGTLWSRYARARLALAQECRRRGLEPDDAP